MNQKDNGYSAEVERRKALSNRLDELLKWSLGLLIVSQILLLFAVHWIVGVVALGVLSEAHRRAFRYLTRSESVHTERILQTFWSDPPSETERCDQNVRQLRYLGIQSVLARVPERYWSADYWLINKTPTHLSVGEIKEALGWLRNHGLIECRVATDGRWGVSSPTLYRRIRRFPRPGLFTIFDAVLSSFDQTLRDEGVST